MLVIVTGLYGSILNKAVSGFNLQLDFLIISELHTFAVKGNIKISDLKICVYFLARGPDHGW